MKESAFVQDGPSGVQPWVASHPASAKDRDHCHWKAARGVSDIRSCAELAAHVGAALAGQQQVEEDDVVAVAKRLAQPARPVRRPG